MMTEAAATAPGTESRAQLVLPPFLARRRLGLVVELSRLNSSAELIRMVDDVFRAGFLFRGLDYTRLMRLAYHLDEASDGLLEIPLATDIEPFPPERKDWYRGVRIEDDVAWYVFEPLEAERTMEVPIIAVDGAGNESVVGAETRVVSERVRLDFDEFVADLWLKGIRYGIDEAAVRALIAGEHFGRAAVARATPAEESVDGGVEEQTEALHRDNAPKTLANGRVDLGQFANRFPQIAKGTLLLMKTPPRRGRHGHALDGQLLDARSPEDFDLADLAGEGTQIETHGGRQFISATMDGFLTLDAASNRISVSEKIVNLEGVNARTTGSLDLQGKDYEEYGDVQEGRSVQGYNLSFHADVFGKVVSGGGRVHLEKNLVGGTALNRDGEIAIDGLASNAHVQLGRGVIRAKKAENCLLVADRVEVQQAFRCTILAEEVEVGLSEGCSIGGKRIRLGISTVGLAEENLVSMLMPDLSGLEKAQADEQRYIEECLEMIDQLRKGLRAMTSEPDLQRYLVMAGKIRRKEVDLTPETHIEWQAQTARMAPAMKRVNQGREDIAALEAEISTVQLRIAQLEAEKGKAGADIACRIGVVNGDTRVRTLVVKLGSTPLARLPIKDLRDRLRLPCEGETRLFAGDRGAFEWKKDAASSPP